MQPKRGSAFLQFDRAERERNNALLESGRDPFAESLQSMIPVNQATQAGAQYGQLAGIAKMLQGATVNRGGMGPLELPNIKGMAKGIAKSTQNADDFEQVGNVGMLERIAKRGATGPEAQRAARNAMRTYAQSQGTGMGVRRKDALLFEKIQNRVGNVGDDVLLKEVQKVDPSWTLDKLQHIKGGRRPSDLRLDAPSMKRPTETVGQGLRGMDDPSMLAGIKEKIAKLPDALRRDAESLITGEKDATQLNPAVLQRLRKAVGDYQPKQRPISGGSGTPNLKLEPKMQAIQDQLQHFLDKTYPPGQKLSPPWMAESSVPARPMAGVTNPYHPDFVKLQDSASNVARSLQRIGDNTDAGMEGSVTFKDLPREAFKIPGGGEAWGQSASRLSPERTIAINPFVETPRSTPIHEALHTLYQMTRNRNQPDAAQGTSISLWPGRAEAGFPRGRDSSYGMRLLEGMYADEPGHAAVEQMTNNILRRTGQAPIYRKNP